MKKCITFHFLCGLWFLHLSPPIYARDPQASPPGTFLSTVGSGGNVEKAILTYTGTKRIAHLDELLFKSGTQCDAMFVVVQLERKSGVKGIPEGIMHSDLFIVRDHVNGKTRIRITDDAFLLNTWNSEKKSIDTREDVLRDIDTTETSKFFKDGSLTIFFND
jgi:hypothetical protein